MYAIIGAMDEEVSALRHRMKDVELKSIGPVDFMFGKLSNKEVVLFKSGIGLSMAAMSTSICLSHFEIDAVINIGTAGGLKPEQNVLDIVVSDIEMPVMNGIELVRAIRSNEKFKALPVIALTSLTREDQKEKGLRAGFDRYEQKLDRTILLESVAAMLQGIRS